MKILVTGGNGQLGRAFGAIKGNFYDIHCLDINQLDFTKPQEVENVINKIEPDVVIHAGAYTNVEKAENDKDSVYKVNVIGTQNIASKCLRDNIKMVYVSTDYVFDGIETLYTEFDEPYPLNVYGWSKLEGEKIATRICPKLFIVRTSWLFGDGNNFVRKILKLTKEKDRLKVVCDQFGTPTYTADLVVNILNLINTDSYGIYHMSNSGSCSWLEFAQEIIKNANIDIGIKPIYSFELDSNVVRPQYSVLRNYMLELTIGDNFRHWKKALKEYMEGGKLN